MPTFFRVQPGHIGISPLNLYRHGAPGSLSFTAKRAGVNRDLRGGGEGGEKCANRAVRVAVTAYIVSRARKLRPGTVGPRRWSYDCRRGTIWNGTRTYGRCDDLTAALWRPSVPGGLSRRPSKGPPGKTTAASTRRRRRPARGETAPAEYKTRRKMATWQMRGHFASPIT